MLWDSSELFVFLLIQWVKWPEVKARKWAHCGKEQIIFMATNSCSIIVYLNLLEKCWWQIFAIIRFTCDIKYDGNCYLLSLISRAVAVIDSFSFWMFLYFSTVVWATSNTFWPYIFFFFMCYFSSSPSYPFFILITFTIITILMLFLLLLHALAWCTSDSPHLHYHQHKSRKRRLGRVMKSPP